MDMVQSSGFVVEKTIYDKIYRFGSSSVGCYCFLKEEKLRKLAIDIIRAIKDGKEVEILVTDEILKVDVGKYRTFIYFIDGPSRYFDNDTIYLVMKNVLRLINGTD